MSRMARAIPFIDTANFTDRRRWLAPGLVLAVIIFLVIDPQWTVQHIRAPGAGSSVASSTRLDPTAYVNRYWQSRILPTARKSAVELPTLLADLKRAPSATAKRYGNVAELGGEPTFLVKGTARVLSVNSSSIPTVAKLDLGNGQKVELQLGPILIGTSVRDALRFINFNQFVDQVTYGEVATAINERIESTALKSIHNSALAGKTINFTGAFTVTPGQPVLVTPILLAVQR